VLPVSDPNASTMAQKVVQYQAVMQLAGNAPQLYNLPLLHRQIIETLGIKNAEKLVPTDDDQKPADPVTENMAIMNGKPVKAFIYQNHEAHIGVHMAAMKDPKLAAIMGQNPMAQQMQAAAMAHISEHLAFAYRGEIEKQLGAAMPSPEENLTPEVEVQLSMLVAKAAQQLLAKNSAEDAQMKVQQAQQDPLIQMQQMELQLKQDDNKRKAQKDMLDMAAKADQIRVEEERIASQERIAQAQLAAKQEADGVRMGIEIGKHKSDKVMQLRQQQQPQQPPVAQPTGTPKQ
jgi:hypothetical protein